MHSPDGVSAWSRFGLAGATGLLVGSLIVGACGQLAGVDFDKARLAEASDGSRSIPGPNDHDVDSVPPRSSCTPAPNTTVCAGKCGPTEDNCNSTRGCSSDCGSGKTCVNGICECVSDGDWCNNRCGQVQDNCGRPTNCGACAGGLPCTNNACGCTPEPLATTCAGKACGPATNNCGQVVACGPAGGCVAPAICKANSCCTDDGQACQGRCGGVVVKNNCGQDVGCPAVCPIGQVCNNGTCCTPIDDPCRLRCGGTASDGCGGTVACLHYSCSFVVGCECGGLCLDDLTCLCNPTPCGGN